MIDTLLHKTPLGENAIVGLWCGIEELLTRPPDLAAVCGGREFYPRKKENAAVIETLLHKTPLGEIVLAAEDDTLIGLWFQGQRYEFAALKNC